MPTKTTKSPVKKVDYIAKRYKVLEDVYRHYLDFQDYYMRTGQHILEAHGLTISFLDLKDQLDKLSPRKREAFLYNVIYDMKQEDVAEKMGIASVTIGQYVVASSQQIAKWYFEEYPIELYPMDKAPKKTNKKDNSDNERVEDVFS